MVHTYGIELNRNGSICDTLNVLDMGNGAFGDEKCGHDFGEPYNIIKISGKKKDCEAAKAALLVSILIF